MTLKDVIINEVNVEFGNGQTLAVSDAVKANYSQNKLGEKSEKYTKTSDISKMHPVTKEVVANIVAYLKSKGLFDKVNQVQNFNTTDLEFKANGDCVVNFDKGGGITIPASAIKKQASVKDKFKKVISEGAYSNGRYEHQEGKKVNKYHPGHANPIYIKERKINGKNRIEKNNDKYDTSRTDKQIKKDVRLWAKDKEIRALREDVLEEDFKETWNKKIKPALIGSTLLATALAGCGLSLKTCVNNTKELAKTVNSIAKSGSTYNMTVGGKDVKFDEKTNVIYVDGKSEKLNVNKEI